MANIDASNVSFTGDIDIGSMMSQIVSANSNSAFIQDFFNNLAMPLIDKIKNTKVEGLKLDLGNILGMDAEHTAGVQREFQQVTRKLLQKIRKQFDKIGDINLDENFNLATLLGNTPQFSFLSRRLYQGTVQETLLKMRKYLNNMLKPNVGLDGKPIPGGQQPGISSLLGDTPQFSWFTRRLYQGTVQETLLKLRRYLNKYLDPASHTSGEFDLSSFLGSTPQYSLITRFWYQGLVRKILSKVQALVQNFELEKTLDITDIIGGTPDFSFWTRWKYQRVVRNLLSKLEKVDPVSLFKLDKSVDLTKVQEKLSKQGDELSNAFEKWTKLPKSYFELQKQKVDTTQPKASTGFGGIKELEDTQEVDVVSFKESALDQLIKAFREDPAHALSRQNRQAVDSIKKEDQTNIFPGALKWLAPLLGGLLGAIGIPALIKGFFDQGPAKGIWKFAGMGALRLGGKVLEKTFLKGLAKKIPIVGAVVGAFYAYKRFQAGDWIGGLLELASGVASIFPGIGTAISVGIDLLSAGRDYAEGGPAAVGKQGGIGKWDKKIWETIKKHYPIKGLLDIGEGVKEIFRGNIVEGLKIIGTGIGEVSTIGLLIDMFGEEKVIGAANAVVAFSGNLLSSIWDWIKEHYPMKGIIEAMDGVKMIFNGNVVEGLKQLGKGFGDVSALGLLTQIFGEDTMKSAVSKGVEVTGDFMQIISKWILDSPPIKWALNIVDGITKILSGQFDAGIDKLGENLPFFATIKSFFSSPVSLPDSMKKAITSFGGFMSSIADAVSSKINEFVDKAKEFFKRLIPSWNTAAAKVQDPKSIIPPNIPTKEDLLPQPTDTYRSEKLMENVVKSATVPLKNYVMQDNSDVVDSLDENNKKLDLLTKTNLQLLTEFKGAGKSLGAIAQNTQDSGDQQSNVNITNSTNAPQVRSGSRDPAYEFRKNVWGKLREA